ncbi:hypothetical protein C1N62_17585 [Nissabacter sp. SGAir0207]|nr:hypothetical protein C1N62_17585 [Nissabacter sp. SGAir0207]
MADHNAIRERDPPLPHRLDPFYPQVLFSLWLSCGLTWTRPDPEAQISVSDCDENSADPTGPVNKIELSEMARQPRPDGSRPGSEDQPAILALWRGVRIIFALRVMPVFLMV